MSIIGVFRNWFNWLLIFVAVVNLGLFVIVGLKPDQLTHIYFFDVGQGDAILIKTAQNYRILIDGGPDASVVTQLDQVLPIWQRRIDLVVLTHPHADHATGLLSVLDRYSVGQFWYTGTNYDSETYRALVDKIKDRHLSINLANQGDTYKFGFAGWSILSPINEQPVAQDANDTSIVGLFTYRNFQLLLTGDASSDTEKIYTAAVSDVDVIKIPHHGSNDASSNLLISKAQPEVGVVMVGANNPFGHPHPDTVARYELANTSLYRTDQVGVVEIITDGLKYLVKTRS